LFAFRKATTTNTEVDGHNSYSRKKIEGVLVIGDNETGFRKIELMKSIFRRAGASALLSFVSCRRCDGKECSAGVVCATSNRIPIFDSFALRANE
jgi:hypothetical protein